MLVLVFTLATAVEAEFKKTTIGVSDDGAFTKLLGDGRRLFSGQSVAMADVYLHSGFYPSIFDSVENKGTKAIQATDDHNDHAHDEHDDDHDAEHEKAMDFMGQPLDPLAGFIRNFRVTQHSHLENGEEREVIPWLKLAIELDPQAVETYAATSFWLRKNLKRVEDARDILREGIRNNPKSFELLYAMGLIYEQDDKNDAKARNIWLAAKRFWEQQSSEAKEASLDSYGKITASLARLENEAGNLPLAIQYFELAKLTSPNPQAVQKQIDDIRSRMTAATNAPGGKLSP